ncbi:wax synthase family protein [Aspergillus saccharolyticus JOP 1030-1]|uniref:Wax synthase domain-containing protein n=1 Tax=Aspergillus saccharolyticus JOP 1030-1 TaxID=1450539 RepID=A0A318ZL66_9EURO|nr:hypothetical protein BP01DRAFT_362844 [Aspergillus saccharolyticus JOP 1030-1]PYH48329.1 hypothetical protein BP01DRAFT_362844 [Aspergillus saccharolyticus JOP 1030-1]
MAVSPDLSFLLVIGLQNLVMLTLLSRTPRNSFLRWICLPSILYFAYLEILLTRLTSTSFDVKIRTGGHAFTFLIQFIDLLFITNVDLTTTIQPNRLQTAWRYLLTIRGIGTPWQLKQLPAYPRVLRTNPPPSRTQYAVRHLAIVVWQVLFLRLLAHPSLHPSQPFYDDGQEFSYRLTQWPSRLVSTYILGVIPSYLFLDILYRCGAMVAVGTGLQTMADWPPLFGNLADAWTLRGFWGKFWHQYLRWPFTTLSTFLTGQVLGLRRHSLLERYLNTFLIFFLSMASHTVCEIVAGVEGGHRGNFLFFAAQVPAIMFEDAVRYVWGWWVMRRQQYVVAGQSLQWRMRTQKEEEEREEGKGVTAAAAAAAPSPPPRLWQRMLGASWVITWIAFSWTWYYFPIIRSMIKQEDRMVAPPPGAATDWDWRTSGLLGLVVGGAVLLRVVFRAEL